MDNGFCNISIKEKKYKKGTETSLRNLGVHLLRGHKGEYNLADKSKQIDNEILIGSQQDNLNQTLNSFLKKNSLTPRSIDTVKAYQVVFSIPKNCFENRDLIEEWKKSVLEFVNSNPIFKDNCLMLVYHGDESQPHIQGVFVPRHQGKLNFKALLGGQDGPEKLHKLHDDFAAAMKPLGFVRGDGTHTNGLTHKQYMKSVSDLNKPAPVPVAMPPVPEAGWFNKNEVIDAQATKIKKLEKQNHQLRKEVARTSFYRTQNQNLKSTNSSLVKLKRKKDVEKMKIDNERLENLRSIDCVDLLEQMGFVGKKEGNTTRIKTDTLNLVVNSENKFTENKTMTQGYGAIDLLNKVFKYTFKESVEYLASAFGYERTTKVALSNKEHTVKLVSAALKSVNVDLPTPKPSNFVNVRNYLVNKRKISSTLIDELAAKKMLYADGKNNCVFTNKDNSFAFLRGTYEGKRFVGVKGEMDFIEYEFNKTNNDNVYLFESTIDALSYRTLNPNKDGSYIVLNGSAMINKVTVRLDQFRNVICCFDNDTQGEKFCDSIKSSTVSNVIVEKPAAKDFNEDLINGNAAKLSPTTDVGNSKDSARSLGETKDFASNSTVRNRQARL